MQDRQAPNEELFAGEVLPKGWLPDVEVASAAELVPPAMVRALDADNCHIKFKLLHLLLLLQYLPGSIADTSNHRERQAAGQPFDSAAVQLLHLGKD